MLNHASSDGYESRGLAKHVRFFLRDILSRTKVEMVRLINICPVSFYKKLPMIYYILLQI